MVLLQGMKYTHLDSWQVMMRRELNPWLSGSFTIKSMMTFSNDLKEIVFGCSSS